MKQQSNNRKETNYTLYKTHASDTRVYVVEHITLSCKPFVCHGSVSKMT